jgi:hypothetical protein
MSLGAGLAAFGTGLVDWANQRDVRKQRDLAMQIAEAEMKRQNEALQFNNYYRMMDAAPEGMQVGSDIVEHAPELLQPFFRPETTPDQTAFPSNLIPGVQPRGYEQPRVAVNADPMRPEGMAPSDMYETIPFESSKLRADMYKAQSANYRAELRNATQVARYQQQHQEFLQRQKELVELSNRRMQLMSQVHSQNNLARLGELDMAIRSLSADVALRRAALEQAQAQMLQGDVINRRQNPAGEVVPQMYVPGVQPPDLGPMNDILDNALSGMPNPYQLGAPRPPMTPTPTTPALGSGPASARRRQRGGR